MMGELKLVTEAEFDQLLKDEKRLLVVDFYATWCGPCKMIGPKVEKLAKEYADVVFIKVDVDEEEELAAKYNIEAMPTFLFFKDGKQVDEMKGANADTLIEKVKQLK